MESLDRYVRMGWHEYRKKEDKTMSEHVKAYVEQKVKEMMAAHSCSVEAKAVGQKWLDALGTEHEAEETKHLLAELEHDIVTVDGLIAFAASETGAQVFGKEKAVQVEAHARELKKSGAKYCDCPACAAVYAILEKKDEMI